MDFERNRDFSPMTAGSNIPIMRLLSAAATKRMGRIALAVVVTTVCGFFAATSGTYGVLGVYSAFNEHQVWSGAGMIYWSLLLVAILCTVGTIGTWIWLFRGETVSRPR